MLRSWLNEVINKYVSLEMYETLYDQRWHWIDIHILAVACFLTIPMRICEEWKNEQESDSITVISEILTVLPQAFVRRKDKEQSKVQIKGYWGASNQSELESIFLEVACVCQIGIVESDIKQYICHLLIYPFIGKMSLLYPEKNAETLLYSLSPLLKSIDPQYYEIEMEHDADPDIREKFIRQYNISSKPNEITGREYLQNYSDFAAVVLKRGRSNEEE